MLLTLLKQSQDQMFNASDGPATLRLSRLFVPCTRSYPFEERTCRQQVLYNLSTNINSNQTEHLEGPADARARPIITDTEEVVKELLAGNVAGKFGAIGKQQGIEQLQIKELELRIAGQTGSTRQGSRSRHQDGKQSENGRGHLHQCVGQLRYQPSWCNPRYSRQ